MLLTESQCIIDQDGKREEKKEHGEHHDNMSLLYQSAEMKKIKPSYGKAERERAQGRKETSLFIFVFRDNCCYSLGNRLLIESV